MGAGPPLDRLVAFLRERDDGDPAVDPAQRSQVLAGRPGGGVTVLLHGLTASPPAWRAVAQALNARGVTVVVPRLPRHGHANRMTTALRGVTARELASDVEAILARVAALGEPMTLAGHSLGATLAVDAAARLPSVARLVAIAPFLGIARVPYEAHPLLVRAMGLVRHVFLWWDPLLRARLEPAHGYPRYTIGSLRAGLQLADRVRGSAHAPPRAAAIDIVLNERESSVNNRTALRLAADWRASGASVAVHRLRGLRPSHDIVEPFRPPARAALATLVAIVAGEHVPEDRIHHVAG